MRGGTTGGTDLVANLIGRNFRHLSLGKLVLLVDLVVVLISAFVYRNYESPLYAIINIFVSSKLIDAVLYGADTGTGKMMFIISPKNKEIAQRIMTEISRGVTELRSRGPIAARKARCFSARSGGQKCIKHKILYGR